MRYLLFYKPYGVLTQFTDRAADRQTGGERRLTLKAFIDVANVYPVGRLDRDSEGLLLLTDDGVLASRLIQPRYGHQRTYWAQVEGVPTEEAIAQLCRGVIIKGYQTRPALARAIEEPQLPPRSSPIRYRKSVPTQWLELVLTEGRNRQVRRMTAAVGYPTLRLVRVQLEQLTLAGLRPGQWRELSRSEIEQLRQRVGGKMPRRRSRRQSRSVDSHR
ncbi:pseudouridine synthase [Synechococcus sp. PCC 7336]|uniref:pseudouridine synthase n=1 Tax=Synechococcus sp. PCC 7336 TaxID=195250 RepID=UPI00034D7FD5|nr:pseudouridine synthase [Synechococcus sp. PCC 7336]